MLLGSDGILGGDLHDLVAAHGHLVPAGGARVGSHGAPDAHGGFLREPLEIREALGADLGLEGHHLQDAGAVAEHEEEELSSGPRVVHPALEEDLLPDVLADVRDVRLVHPRLRRGVMERARTAVSGPQTSGSTSRMQAIPSGCALAPGLGRARSLRSSKGSPDPRAAARIGAAWNARAPSGLRGPQCRSFSALSRCR